MFTKIKEMIDSLVELLSGGVANLLMAVAFIAFLWAVINYIWQRRKGTGAEGLKQAGSMLFGSIYGLFIMVAVWGIVYFISSNLLGTDYNKTTIEKPQTMWKLN